MWSSDEASADHLRRRQDIVISLGATYGLYIISSILHADPWHLITCFLQYMMFLPSYVIVLSIFAFSNLHDLAWGTKVCRVYLCSLGSLKPHC